MTEIRFWYHLPTKVSPTHTLECAEKAEEVGFDVVSMMDHLIYLPEDRGRGSIPECWTTLSAVAARTNLTVSPLVMCSLFRNPALVAKMFATLDQLTRGRVYLGIGACWWEEEFRQYGYEWMSAKGRVDRTIEAVKIIKALWTQDEVDYRGEFWQLESCHLEPRPYTKPHPPIFNGGAGPRMLRLTGELCDGWIHAIKDPSQFCQKRDEILRYAKGRAITFVNYLAIEAGKFSYEDAAKQIEGLIPEGVTDFDIILDPDSENIDMLDRCRDLIASFKSA